MAADRLDKLETAVKKLGSDMAEVRRELGEFREEMGEVREGIDEIQRTQTALTNAMMQAIKQLGIATTHELRISRLEAAVFRSKH